MKIGNVFCWLSRICFAKKLKGWNSSSGRKIPSSVFRWLLLLGVMSIMPWQGAMATGGSGCSWSAYSHFDKATWVPEEGVIHYKIRACQTWGGQGNYSSCWGGDNNEGMILTQHTKTTRSIYINIYYKDLDNSGSTIDNKELKFKWTKENGPAEHGTDETTWYMEFDVPVEQEDLGGSVNIDLKGYWWRAGDSGEGVDERINVKNHLTVSLTYPADPELKITNAEYACNGNNPIIKFDWTRSKSDGIAGKGNIYLCQDQSVDDYDSGMPGTTSSSASANIEAFTVGVSNEAPYHNLNKTYNYWLKQTYTINPDANGIKTKIVYEYESKNKYKITAYPQVSDLTYESDPGALLLYANWEIPEAPSSDFNNSTFLLTTTKILDGKESDPKTEEIKYQPGQSTYSHKIALEKDEEAQYKFSIKRSATESLSCFASKEITTKLISTKHKYPTNLKVELTEGGDAKVMWDTIGTVWSEGTRFIIVRSDSTDAKEYEKELSEDEYNRTTYVDDMVIPCHRYTYKAKLIPGNKSYSELNDLMAKNEILPIMGGSLKNFEVSKGYYSDKVDLSWNTTPGYNEFVVERREYNNDESTFSKIKSIDATSGLSDFLFEDKTCQPGIVYEYRVYALFNCDTSIKSSKDTLVGYGFRTPTGDFTGRVTFANGQAVDSVEVRLETEDEISLQALSFNGTGTALIPGDKILKEGIPMTMQAWIKPNSIEKDTMSLINKSDFFELGLINGSLFFRAGDASLTTDSLIDTSRYTHVTAVVTDTAIKIYLDGDLAQRKSFPYIYSMPSSDNVILGKNYKGIIDEVRLWSRALEANEINKDYSRYLIGNEDGLNAYYTFDFMPIDEFYDRSYKGNATYNGNTGKLQKVDKIKSGLTNNELSYKGYTNKDGKYSILSVPYFGNGTSYTITPKKGNHQFAPVQEVRFISSTEQSHTVNFTDNSSFDLTGYVVYMGGNYPVEGVHFTIDGVPALDKTGQYIQTDAKGKYTISVPVGIHEVKAVKDGHGFYMDGRVCNIDGSDRNYQDNDIANLYDTTKVKYIGRICGGTVQEAYPVGFSLSKNNLANDMRVILTATQSAYNLQDSAYSNENNPTKHPILQSVSGNSNKNPKTTICEYNKKDINIHVNNETGEFIAWVFPIEYKVSLQVNGHQDITGDNSVLNLSAYALNKYETYEYSDSALVNGEMKRSTFKDTIEYRQKQIFTKRYRASMEMTPLSASETPLAYFGEKSYTTKNAIGTNKDILLYNSSTKTYTFGLPVFITSNKYKMRYDVFEVYPFYIDSKLHVDSSKIDRVPVENVKVTFNNKLGNDISLDTLKRIYEFQVGEPNMTTAKGTIAATFTYGDSDNPTSVSWENPMGNANGEAYVFGSHQTGTDFVTGGPDKLLCVLRDPPGSNSYSYLEKGTSFSQSSTYNGAFNHEGSEMWTTGYELKTMTINLANTPATSTGTSNILFETGGGIKAGIVQEAEYTGANTKSSSYTLTTRIQTSDDPSYVGADADLYVGYSTNISFGSTQDVTVFPIAFYDSVGGDKYFEETYAKTDSFVIAKTSGISSIEEFNTMFAYPQIFVEQTLLPNLEDLKRSLLLPMTEYKGDSAMNAMAKNKKQNIYVSKVPITDKHFGEKDQYNVYFYDEKHCDTINYLNQAIENWNRLLSENDRIKLAAKEKAALQNYSFHAGSNIEYSESYSSALASSHSFSVKLGVALSDDNKQTTAGTFLLFEYEEQFTTTQGGEFESEAEASHSKGFVLAEDGDDYLSVDVIREPILEDVSGIYDFNTVDTSETYVDWVNAGSADTSKLKKKDFYPTFVFITRGGATSCPYEGAYYASHVEGEGNKIINVATKKIEVPKIDMPIKYIENVPSGEAAYLTIYMRNESETGADQRFNLSLMDASNPNGAVTTIDGNSMSGTTLSYLVPAGGVLEKTLAVYKGSALNYDHLKLILSSQCQEDIADTVDFTVHYIPSCSNVTIEKPTNNWTYNTNCSKDTIDGVEKHYMPITISGFDVNYADFEHLELQYKPLASSDNGWLTLAYYYKDDSLARNAQKNGLEAFAINSEDAGNIYYNFYMDELPDQMYDLRAVSYCNINNELYENPSKVVSGIKDMYNPRLFGSPKPANGVLTIDDDIRIDFNETIAEGMLTVNNFEITGVRNGAVSDHSVAISLDGENDYLTTEVTRNFANKDLTFECWVNYDSLQNATFFSHGDAKESISMGMNKEGKVVVKIGNKELVSEKVPAWEKSSWNHVALVYDNENQTVTAYVNYTAVINAVDVNAYSGNGLVEVGRDVATESGNFYGKVDQFRIWNAVRSSATIQANSTSQLSGNDLNLMAYYEMEEAKGTATEDKARGANLVMKGGGTWALPEGRSAEFDGESYVAMNSSSAVITSDMDFTLEFWFNANTDATNQTILSNGDGISNKGEDPSKLFSIGFDETGNITFRHNGNIVAVDGKFNDNSWHNFTLAVNRSSDIARIYMDGELNTYFPAEQIGRIASDKLFAGAHVWHEESSTDLTIDQYFTGKVDEIRLWNLYRQQSQIESFYNQKSSGKEMGLLLYYPFEEYVDWQGRSEMQFSLDDKGNDAVNGEGKKIAFATTEGNISESVNIPPVKSKGTTSSLLFDWVVNDDALIITLQEQDYRIEKTIVSFTVDQVQDVNGNYIVSPITWSAYIDRNQLKWMDDAVTVNKKQNEPYKFEMPIVNKGGSVINYSLKNMPSWLSASTESGAINPLEKQTIEFEIDPSLAVGAYDEVVYLTNSNNVTEPLTLNVTVEGDTPDWSVDPSKYEYSMAVFAQIKVDNQFSNDQKDMLAAFYNGECVGVANMSHDKTMDLWYAMMTVYSNSSDSHKLDYRIWDASKGLMYMAKSNPEVIFHGDMIYGQPTEPIVFSNDSVKYQNIQLKKGWNWVSFNLADKAMSDLDTYLAGGTWGKQSFVKDLNVTPKSANYSLDDHSWTNSGVSLNNRNMFKIHSEVDQTLSVSGVKVNLDTAQIILNGGSWNYIAYLPDYSLTLKAALAGYEANEGDVIKSIDGFAMYYGNEWIGSLKSLQPNCGYMMKNTDNVQKTFRYPSSSSVLRSAISVKSSAYESNMSIIASAPEKREGDVLRALVGTEENSVVEVALSDDYALQFINVSANAGDKVRFTMERDGVIYEANNALNFAGDAVYGTPDNPFVLNFNVGGVETLTVYPNPMDVELNVAGKLDGEGDVTLELFDVLGVLVFEKQVSAQNNVLDESINVSGLVPGSYMLKVNQGDESKVFKVVKK